MQKLWVIRKIGTKEYCKFAKEGVEFVPTRLVEAQRFAGDEVDPKALKPGYEWVQVNRKGKIVKS